MTHCNVTGNVANARAGGVYVQRSNLVMMDCTIDENTAGTYGGGLVANQKASVTLKNCLFEKNVASTFGGAIFSNNSNGNNAIVVLGSQTRLLDNVPAQGCHAVRTDIKHVFEQEKGLNDFLLSLNISIPAGRAHLAHLGRGRHLLPVRGCILHLRWRVLPLPTVSHGHLRQQFWARLVQRMPVRDLWRCRRPNLGRAVL